MPAAEVRKAYIAVLANVAGSHLIKWYFWAMGATVRRGAYINTHLMEEFDLVTVDEDAKIGHSAVITGHYIENCHLMLGPVFLGKRCSVGPLSVVMPHTSMDEKTKLDTMSMAPVGCVLPPNSQWEGSPLRKQGNGLNGMPSALYKRSIYSQRTISNIGQVDNSSAAGNLPLAPSIVCALHVLGVLLSAFLSGVALMPLHAVVISLYEVSAIVSVVSMPLHALIIKLILTVS